jgi:hypothetical protein
MAKGKAAPASGGNGNAVLYVLGGVAVVGVVAVIYEVSKKPAAPAAAPGILVPGTSIIVPNATVTTLSTQPYSTPLGVQLPGATTTLTAPAPASYVVSNPGQAAIAANAGSTWTQAVAGTSYAAGTHVREDWASPPSTWATDIPSEVAANTFGAQSVTVYPPGSNIPADWPGGANAGAILRLDYVLNDATVLAAVGNMFGAPTYWVFT